MKKYAIVISKVPNSNYCAYAPDVDGCIATGDSIEEVTRLMKEGLEFHFEGTREDGLPNSPAHHRSSLRRCRGSCRPRGAHAVTRPREDDETVTVSSRAAAMSALHPCVGSRPS